ncbi:GlsB/YeaQ/YmgE family stress response membrane protein [Amycolatopsis jiangsuensis]|uniref:Putative membrane protein YeaQ/YmgE (Transglycosylase-associated protein family) n=1 Tax=Amycolatopsis jiangsuensis TaxID=1181879 RepID=A0A840J3F4_9PSEU|nr:GlsB/YeaQ/YmgE family stress response membrane protein [Amycolatopsis jiangsuensis]MBB4687938.1 putative membrane protein YeaQ/YmgE (transglycosylase-associated protein family) [Amycolatopsis jiangsuensis]
MGIILWIVFGALVGWLANLVVGGRERRRQGCLVSVLVGVLGAALGGFVYRLATGEQRQFDFDFPSFGVAILGAIVLLLVLRLVSAVAGGHRDRDRR